MRELTITAECVGFMAWGFVFLNATGAWEWVSLGFLLLFVGGVVWEGAKNV